MVRRLFINTVIINVSPPAPPFDVLQNSTDPMARGRSDFTLIAFSVIVFAYYDSVCRAFVGLCTGGLVEFNNQAFMHPI